MATKKRGRPPKLRLDDPPELTDEQHAQAAAFYAKHRDHITEIWRNEHWRYIDHWGGMAKAVANSINHPVRHVRYLDASALSGMDVDAIAVAYREQRAYEVAALLVKRTSGLFSRLESEVPEQRLSLPEDLRREFSRVAMTPDASMVAKRQVDRNDKAADEAWIVHAVTKARRLNGPIAAAVAYLAEVHGLGERMVFKAYRAHVERSDPDWEG